VAVNGVKTEYEVNKADVITVEDGYVVVNGVKTEHKVHTEPTISVIDGYVAVNGVKTEYEVNKADVITVEDGYVVVNGVKTEHKVHTEPTISIVDGYIAVNGVKTEYEVEIGCDHIWNTTTIAPTCTDDGYDVKTCSICNKSIRTNAIAATSHKFSINYATDEEYHWLVCTVCSETKDKKLHTPNDENVCTACQRPISSTPGVIYAISADETYAEVIGYEGTATRVKIADEYNGIPVKSIYAKAFRGKSISLVVLGENIISIGDEAFYGCSKLEQIYLPEGLLQIGEDAFYSSGLKSVTIPGSVQTIRDKAFCYCSKLTDIVINEGVTSIAYSMFFRCSSLRNITLPDSITTIGANAFGDCPAIKYNELNNIKYLGNADNLYLVLMGFDSTTKTSYEIASTTKVIANGAFDGNVMNCIIVPKSVLYINNAAFLNCGRLNRVYYLGDSNDWNKITIGYSNSSLASATKLFYAETPPMEVGNYWHYVDGVPAIWDN
ncbi:MAG: hypothetical protein E7353_10015, partial [Clostridiales bacterium]|nr:hypothetical protein [Clostridiales bacterium]